MQVTRGDLVAVVLRTRRLCVEAPPVLHLEGEVGVRWALLFLVANQQERKSKVKPGSLDSWSFC